MYSGPLLKSGSLKDYTALGGIGHPVYSAADQIRTAVAQQIGVDAANLLAIPKFDEQGRHIDWYAPVEGDIVPWAAASPEERETARRRIAELNARIESHASGIVAAPRSNDFLVFGRLLALCTHIPDPSHIFLVGGRPVVTFWGFVPAGADASRHVLAALASEQEVRTSASRPPPGIATPVATGSGWRHWFWWLLPLLLLLPLALFGLRSCGYIGLPPWLPLPGTENTQIAVAPGSSGTVNGVIVTNPTTGTVDVNGGAPAGTDAVPPSGLIQGTTNQGVTGPADTITGDTGNTGIDATPGDTKQPADTGANSQNGADQQAGADKNGDNGGTPPPTPDNTPPQSDQTNPPQPDQVNPPGQDQNAAGQDQKPAGQDASAAKPGQPPTPDIPPGGNASQPSIKPLELGTGGEANGPAGFMQGQWRSQTSLRSTASNTPVTIGYQFDKQGKGSTTLRLGTGVSCSGPSSASVAGGKLTIQDQGQLNCTNGKQFQGSTVECAKGADNKTHCVGRYPNGQQYDILLGQ